MNKTLADTFGSLIRLSPAVKQRVITGFYNLLARRFGREDWTFMNYGYADAGPGQRISLPPSEEHERYSTQLYHHLATRVPLTGLDVLEVGCGRGGGSAYIHGHLEVASMTGLDFAASNIALCQSNHVADGLRFVVGNALELPFTNACFDAVINVESSHCYPSVPTFLAEVQRVLRPGGYFLCADIRPQEAMQQFKQEIHACGMDVIAERDITTEVIRAIDADNERKTRLIDASVPWWLRPAFREFAAVKGTENYAKFKNGQSLYRSFVLKKPEREVEETRP